MDLNQSFRPYGFGQGSHGHPLPGMPPVNPMDFACWGYGQGTYNAPPADHLLEESEPAAAPSRPRPRKVITSRTKMSNFGTHEDVNLVNSWLEVSCDPIINTGQRKERLWDRILV
jgi:hypothetical protein